MCLSFIFSFISQPSIFVLICIHVGHAHAPLTHIRGHAHMHTCTLDRSHTWVLSHSHAQPCTCTHTHLYTHGKHTWGSHMHATHTHTWITMHSFSTCMVTHVTMYFPCTPLCSRHMTLMRAVMCLPCITPCVRHPRA